MNTDLYCFDFETRELLQSENDRKMLYLRHSPFTCYALQCRHFYKYGLSNICTSCLKLLCTEIYQPMCSTPATTSMLASKCSKKGTLYATTKWFCCSEFISHSPVYGVKSINEQTHGHEMKRLVSTVCVNLFRCTFKNFKSKLYIAKNQNKQQQPLCLLRVKQQIHKNLAGIRVVRKYQHLAKQLIS